MVSITVLFELLVQLAATKHNPRPDPPLGLGGVGKSQLAIEYAYRIRLPNTPTESETDRPSRVSETSPTTSSYPDIFQLLYDWLRGEKSGRWILMLDNVDAADFLLHNPADHTEQRDGANSQSQPLVSYLPNCQHGSILVTTRNKHAALTLAEERDIIAVDPMHQVEAITLAQNKLERVDKQGDIQSSKRQPTFRRKLRVFHFCDRQGIPESLLRASDEKEGATSRPAQYRRSPALDSSGVESDSSIDDEFETDVSSLRDYSFTSAVGDGKTFEMHILVQLATKRWLGAEGQKEKWKSEFIRHLDIQLPTGAYENWATCQVLLPHTVSAAAQRPKDEASSKGLASIIYKAAWYLWLMGRGYEAQKRAEDAKKLRLRYLGGRTEIGHWEAAEKLFVEVMETRKQKLGPAI
ncbi:hypothetical protein PG988_006599 [Apiospora saccharicola]